MAANDTSLRQAGEYGVFISGSKMPGAPSDEIKRFCSICEAIGRALANGNYALVGCPPHWERILASQHAKKGLHDLKPTATFSTEGIPDNRLYAEDRIRFVQVADAAIFVGGTSGTKQEFDLCRSHNIKPLIAIAGAGGAGADLARRMAGNPGEFWNQQIDAQIISILASSDAEPEQYAMAVLCVLAKHNATPSKGEQDKPNSL